MTANKQTDRKPYDYDNHDWVKSRRHIDPKLYLALVRATGQKVDSTVVETYIALQVVAAARRGRQYYERTATIAGTLAPTGRGGEDEKRNLRRVTKIVEKVSSGSPLVSRLGVNGARRRPWAVTIGGSTIPKNGKGHSSTSPENGDGHDATSPKNGEPTSPENGEPTLPKNGEPHKTEVRRQKSVVRGWRARDARDDD